MGELCQTTAGLANVQNKLYKVETPRELIVCAYTALCVRACVKVQRAFKEVGLLPLIEALGQHLPGCVQDLFQ